MLVDLRSCHAAILNPGGDPGAKVISCLVKDMEGKLAYIVARGEIGTPELRVTDTKPLRPLVDDDFARSLMLNLGGKDIPVDIRNNIDFVQEVQFARRYEEWSEAMGSIERGKPNKMAQEKIDYYIALGSTPESAEEEAQSFLYERMEDALDRQHDIERQTGIPFDQFKVWVNLEM